MLGLSLKVGRYSCLLRFLCEEESYSTDVVEQEPAGARHHFDVSVEPRGFVSGHTKVLLHSGEGGTVELSNVMERSWSGKAVPGRKSSSVLSRFIPFEHSWDVLRNNNLSLSFLYLVPTVVILYVLVIPIS
jgi:hypothetical protein